MEKLVYFRTQSLESNKPKIWWETDEDGGHVNISIGSSLMSIPMQYIKEHQDEFNKLSDFVCEKPEEVVQ